MDDVSNQISTNNNNMTAGNIDAEGNNIELNNENKKYIDPDCYNDDLEEVS